MPLLVHADPTMVLGPPFPNPSPKAMYTNINIIQLHIIEYVWTEQIECLCLYILNKTGYLYFGYQHRKSLVNVVNIRQEIAALYRQH